MQNCFAVPGTGIALNMPPNTSLYFVPDGQTLVVTAVDIFSGEGSGSPCDGNSLAYVPLLVPFGDGSYNGATRKSWIVPAGVGTAHYVYPSGILFASGTGITNVVNATSGCTLTLDMHGYLTAQ